MDGVDQFIVALERSGLLHIAVYGFGHHLSFLQFARPSADFHFAEHIPGKAGGIAFLAFAFQGIAVGTHLGFANVTDVDALSGRAFHIVQAHPTRDLFSEIDAIASFSQSFHFLGLEFFHHSVGRSVLCHQTAEWLLSQYGLFPLGIIEVCGVPSVLFQACIVVFALIDHVAHNSAFGDFPRRITHDDVLGTVLVGQLHLEQKTRRAIALYPMLVGIIEPVTENHSQRIITLSDLVGQVVGEVHHLVLCKVVFHRNGSLQQARTVVVIGLVRHQYIIAHFLPVQGQFIITQSRNPYACRLQAFLYLESLAQQRSGRRSLVFQLIQCGIVLPRYTNPLGFPFFFWESGYPYGRFAPCGGFIVLVPHSHSPPTRLSGR